MKAPVVRIKLRVRLPDGSRRYLDPVFSANSRLKSGYATLDGTATHLPNGVYNLRYLKGTRRVWEPVGKDAHLALVTKHKQERALAAKAAGLAIVGERAELPPKTSLKDAAAAYLIEIETHKSKKTFAVFTQVGGDAA